MKNEVYYRMLSNILYPDRIFQRKKKSEKNKCFSSKTFSMVKWSASNKVHIDCKVELTSQQLISELIQILPYPTCVVEKGGQILSCNADFFSCIDIPKGFKRNIIEVVHSRDIDRFFGSLNKTSETGERTEGDFNTRTKSSAGKGSDLNWVFCMEPGKEFIVVTAR